MKFFKGYMRDFFNRRKCDHEFVRVRDSMLNLGMSKVITYRCKCGKEKVEHV